MNRLFCILFFCNLVTYGQTKECILLKELMDSEKISNIFYVKNDSVTIIDRPKVLFECQNYISKPIISYEQAYMEITPDSRTTIMNNKNIIILFKSEHHRGNINLFFWQPYSGANLKVTAKISSKNKKIRKISYQEGVF